MLVNDLKSWLVPYCYTKSFSHLCVVTGNLPHFDEYFFLFSSSSCPFTTNPMGCNLLSVRANESTACCDLTVWYIGGTALKSTYLSDCFQVWPPGRRGSSQLDRRGDRDEHWHQLPAGSERWHHPLRVSLALRVLLGPAGPFPQASVPLPDRSGVSNLDTLQMHLMLFLISLIFQALFLCD